MKIIDGAWTVGSYNSAPTAADVISGRRAGMRVPLPQSAEKCRGLKANGVPYVCRSREGHGWNELRHRLFTLQIEMEFFEKHVFNRSYAWEKAPAS
ncbi:MAG TPA: hypothetical protein VF239_15355 [Vicinamibacterales bacterium]